MIVVFGANGMLGRYVVSYLKNRFDVIPVTRENIDLSSTENFKKIDNFLKKSEPEYIINCAGSIKPVVDSQSSDTTYIINSVFPQYLGHLSETTGTKTFHITTDCVFSGLDGPYSQDSVRDASDTYGISKKLGESPFNCNIRTSIVGEELTTKRSLVEWAKSNTGKQVSGYTNHLWNGVTCLELAKYLNYLIQKNQWDFGDYHFWSETVTKCQLLQLLSNVYGLDLLIKPVDAPFACDRTMHGERLAHDEYNPPTLAHQIEEMFNYKEQLCALGDF